ncbi:MAG: dockerin type I repeat-containing protein [Deltaproteobacteria bacterium]|nr:dockerin type I repeat-containing protein [Deltaproteobacteria bacterium]
MTDAAALDVRLGWRPVQPAAGYRVYLILAGLPLATPLDVGLPPPDGDGVIRHVYPNLPLGTLLTFSVSAYDDSGREGALSNPLSLSVAATPSASSTPTASSTRTAGLSPPPSASRTSTRAATPAASPTAPPSPTPTPTSGGAARVRGRVRFAGDDSPLPDVAVTLDDGSALRATTTDGDGAFALAAASGATSVLSAARDGADGGAVSALDAAYVLQAVGGTRTLDARQVLACDVTGNGTLSALDASYILRRAVDPLAALPAAATCARNWLFLPDPAPVTAQQTIAPRADASCTAGAIVYAPLLGDVAQQDFIGVLLGDCTGNWRAAGAAQAELRWSRDAPVRLGPPRRRADDRWSVAVVLTDSRRATAFQLRIAYDPRRAALARVRPADDDAIAVVSEDRPGRAAVAVAAAAPFAAERGVVARLVFDADAAPQVELLDAQVDE